jgi:hypothetical protein
MRIKITWKSIGNLDAREWLDGGTLSPAATRLMRTSMASQLCACWLPTISPRDPFL